MKKVLPTLVFLAFFLTSCNFPQKNNAGLQIFSQPQADVFLNSEKIGQTPFLSKELAAGDYDLKIATGSASWQTKIKLNGGALTVVNRQLSSGNFFDEQGEILTLEDGKGLVVTSNPSGAEVNIDDQKKGVSPLVLSNQEAGSFRISLAKEGYLSRSVAVQVHSDFIKEYSSSLTRSSSESSIIFLAIVNKLLVGFIFVK